MTYRSQWEVNEKTLGPAFFQKRAKEDKEQDIGGKHIGHDPEHPVTLVEDAGAEFGESGPGMGDQIRSKVPVNSI